MGWKKETKKYQDLILRLRRVMIRPEDRGRGETLLYWQQTIFVVLLLGIIVLGFPAAVSGSIQFKREGNSSMAAAILIYYAFFSGLAFFRSIRYRLRLMLLGGALYAIGILLLITTGPYGAGLVYLCIAYVHLSLHLSRKGEFFHAASNILIFCILSALYYFGLLDQYRIAEYGSAWWIILINMVLVNIFITQTIGFVLQGMEQRFHREKEVSGSLRRIGDENTKQIRLLKSLRKVGSCLFDSRLVLSERLKIMQEDLHSELTALSSTISLMDKESNESVYLSSIPHDFQGMSIHVPQYTGPFLMLSSSEEKESYPEPRSILMKQAGRGGIYFGSYFYTPEQKGYLELLLRRSPGLAELEYLQMHLLQLSGAITNEQLIRQLEDSTNLLENSYDEILMTWVRIMELRNIEKKGHNKQVVGISLKLAELLDLSGEKKRDLRRGALLHDIGKLGIPDSILHKPSALNRLEWDIIRKHPQIGRDSVINIPFLRESVPVIYSHHERWNGKGYPEGLKKGEIPILARVFIIADIYNSLTSDRSDRKALPQEKALLYMKDQKGQIFDPEILEFFLQNFSALIEDDPMDAILNPEIF